ncbi:adenosylcobinamide-GDP ribazoletransferase [Methylomarinum sp. Ch1-1]|uniref:Adenosylcobinamide-GDP ribazoletransferase n=1 Tax=Methylomarinum roseum TaxID=3067653 RepID=A0AAU7NVL1_9GAMM|nr:adenosylcobinamide-GDP ribazoletransferase [Methylomarinum sp. Ch1-1]MDP4523010.1 adenosylcobinamide-GDP ribazoletransferase [Methylomarinum sp. Ch1-1]
MYSFALALQFLTRIPVPFSFIASDRQLGLSVLYYPLIGLLIGAIVTLLAVLTEGAGEGLQAALLLTVWVMLTGGLHLDGLADCADAWAGGLGDRQRTLEIMKDPAAGPMAVIMLVLLLLLKWTALVEILVDGDLTVLWCAPLLGRAALLQLMLSAPYVRKQGLAETLIQNLPRLPGAVLVLIIVALVFAVLGLIPLLAAALMSLLVYALAMQRLGGMTGDVYGATVELVEMAVLLTVAIA